MPNWVLRHCMSLYPAATLVIRLDTMEGVFFSSAIVPFSWFASILPPPSLATVVVGKLLKFMDGDDNNTTMATPPMA